MKTQDYCEIERPIMGTIGPNSGLYAVREQTTYNGESMILNPADYRDLIFSAKTRKEQAKLIFKWTQMGQAGLWSNMSREHQEMFIDLKERYLAD